MCTLPPPPAPAASGTAAAAPEELQRTLERLGFLQEVAGVVSHDLKNPLAALLLGVQRLGRLAGEASRPQAASLVARLEWTMQGMAQLLDGLADLSRLDAREVSLDRRSVPLAPLLQRVADGLGGAVADRRQRLELSLGPGVPEQLECDGDRLVQALNHLVAHAVRLSPEGATVRLGAADDGGELVLTVSDQAPPLPPDALAQLLAPAPRPCGPARLNQHLGLLIARCLAEAHGGRLEIECAADRGSTFRVRLPASPPRGAGAF